MTSLSCSSARSCAAGGEYIGQARRLTGVRGERRRTARGARRSRCQAWGPSTSAAPPVSGSTRSPARPASSCAAAGSYTDGSDEVQAFVVCKWNGTWSKAIEVPGLVALNVGGKAEAVSISCAKAGYCGAGGYYYGGSTADPSHDEQAFVVTETNGVWNTAIEVPGSAALNTAGDAGVSAVSCGAARPAWPAASTWVTSTSRSRS